VHYGDRSKVHCACPARFPLVASPFVQLVRFSPEQGREIDRFGSAGARIAPLARGDSQVVVLHLAAGGSVGRHPSVGTQLLAVVAGSGTVSGADGVEHAVEPGVVAVWEPGEEHETRTETGLTAVLVEGPSLDVPARR
jgi:quercetin dioxygenase-like cupin family protein